MSFKGIALCTPGGDVAYAVDPSKQQNWHAELCEALQFALNLTEKPYFLIPHGSATVDVTYQGTNVQFFAEAGAIAIRYRLLLNTLFHLPNCLWQPIVPEAGAPPIPYLYYEKFPRLWQSHNQIISINQSKIVSESPKFNETGYVIEVFVRSDSADTILMLRSLREVLDSALTCPYTLKVVDVVESPDLAEARKIMATPTLLRIWPLPMRRLVGSVDNPDRLIELLLLR